MSTITINQLKQFGAEVTCDYTNGSYDLTTIWRIKFPDGIEILAKLWIGDDNYRQSTALNEILSGEASFRMNEMLALTPDFSNHVASYGIHDYMIDDYLIDGQADNEDDNEFWNHKTRKDAKASAIDYMTKLLHSTEL